MRLRPIFLSDYRRRRRAAVRAPFEPHKPIVVLFRAKGSSPKRCDIVLRVHEEGHALDADQAVELANELLRAAAACTPEDA